MYAIRVSAGHEPTNTRSDEHSARCSRTLDWIGHQAAGPEDEDDGDEETDEAEVSQKWRQIDIEEWPLR